MDFDIIVIGGSFAGQAAAIQLARARRHVLLLDARRPRNRFASESHGFLGQDGRPPSDIMAIAYEQLAPYPTVDIRETEAVAAEAVEGGFRVFTADGGAQKAKRLILATGVRDDLPPVPGLAERWGITVLHCPYCHGYELNQHPVGVLACNDLAFHQAMMVRDWGPTTLFTQEIFVPSPEQAGALRARDIAIEPSPVVELLGEAPALEAVTLADGREIRLSGLYLASETVLVGDLADRLGCEFKDGMTGPLIAVDAFQQTSVSGVFAAGDATQQMANATIAAASGVMAASGTHRSLVFEGYEGADE